MATELILPVRAVQNGLYLAFKEDEKHSATSGIYTILPCGANRGYVAIQSSYETVVIVAGLTPDGSGLTREQLNTLSECAFSWPTLDDPTTAGCVVVHDLQNPAAAWRLAAQIAATVTRNVYRPQYGAEWDDTILGQGAWHVLRCDGGFLRLACR
jgi:hypothetical protein